MTLFSTTNVHWWPVDCCEATAKRLINRHYSKHRYADHRPVRRFVGPGEYSVYITACGDAVFVWRVFIDDCELGGGVNCAAFRNETRHLSSDLIREADELADRKWPEHRRHYTYVNPRRVRSRNPGYCFIKAGWRRCGITKGGLLCLERVRAA